MKRIGFALLLFFVSLTAFAQFVVPTAFPFLPTLPTTPSDENDVSRIALYGDIDDKIAHKVCEQIQKANKDEKNKDPIYLYINSPGGEIAAGGLIIDAMIASRRVVYTVDIELAASMAAIIHQYGAKRFMYLHATLMFHQASAGASGYINHIESRTIYWAKMFSRYEGHVAKRAGITVEKLRTKEEGEWWLLSDEAVVAHFSDGVLDADKIPKPE